MTPRTCELVGVWTDDVFRLNQWRLGYVAESSVSLGDWIAYENTPGLPNRIGRFETKDLAILAVETTVKKGGA